MHLPLLSSQSSNFGDDHLLALIFALSHNQMFDHAALFPSGVLDSAASSVSSGGNIGPVWRPLHTVENLSDDQSG